MTQVTPATPDQQQAVLKVVAEFQKALLPARLADTNSNGVVIAAALSKRSLPFTVENLIHVVNELLFSDVLTWLVEPKKLQAHRHEKPTKIDNPLKLEADRAEKIKAVEAAAAKSKATAAAVAKAKEIIAGYAPARNSARGGTIDYTNQSKYQRYWSDLLNNVEKNVAVGVADRSHIPGNEDGGHAITVSDAESFVIWLAKDRDHQYAVQDRRRERM